MCELHFDVKLCYFEPVILVQWTKDLWLMSIVSKHLEKGLSVFKNVNFDLQSWIMCLEIW